MVRAAIDGQPAAHLQPREHQRAMGRVVALVGAHGGAGTTTAALAVAHDADRGVCLIDADLSGSDTMFRLGLSERVGDAGIAGIRDGTIDPFAQLARRTAFGWALIVCPRPDLAWLIRDGAVGDIAREARRHADLVVIDAGRPLGPACEPVLSADVVVVVGHATRPDAMTQMRRRLQRLGVDDLRLVDCPTAPALFERLLGRVRYSTRSIDVLRGDELVLRIEGRLATLGPREY